MKIRCSSLQNTRRLAGILASYAHAGDIIALYGTLGAGKTAFTRFFIQSLTGEETEVPSPTFTLLQTYEAAAFEIFHYDLYRLEREEDVYDLGVEEAFYEAVNLIEWPEKMGKLLPVRKILKVEITCEGEERIFELSSENPSWEKRLNKMEKELLLK